MTTGSRVYASFYALAWLILATIFGWAVAPTIETRSFPVYSKFEIVTAEQTPDGVLAVFKFTKHRDCEPRGLSWYLGEIGTSTAVNASAPEGVRPNRPIGPSTSSPYLLEGITVSDLQTRVIAQLRNQCTIFGFPLPWVTVSDVYP